MARGFVTAITGPQYTVLIEGREAACVPRGRLRRERQSPTSLVVIGDWVEVTLAADGTGAIEAVEPRRTWLERPGFRNRTRLAAANLDQLVVVQASRLPAFNRALVERFLAIASRGGMSGIAVVNKCELEPEDTLASWVEPLRSNGVPVILTSAKTGRGIDALRAALGGKLSAMVGQSGVGKSSLVNALDPGFRVRTAAVSEATRKGRHTTSASRLYPLAGGGFLADTPGIRELALFEGDRESVAVVFPEIVAAAAECRFRSCSHSHEPQCAVKDLVASGAIEEGRYRNFLKLNAGS